MMVKKGASLFFFALFLTACKDPSQQAGSCACDEFPFPAACQSECESGVATVQSVDLQNHTAKLEIRRGDRIEEKTISLAELPAAKIPEKGTQFRVLSKKNPALNKPSVVRYIKEPPPK